jgi:Na+-driven multidrug efflux pump
LQSANFVFFDNADLVYLGIADAVAVRVSHHISNNQAPAARSASVTGLVSGVGFGLLAAVLVFTGCIPMLSNDLEVLAAIDRWTCLHYSCRWRQVAELTRNLLLPLALCQLFDGVTTVGFGVLRGVSRQSLAAVESLLGLVVVGFPVGLYLAIKQGLLCHQRLQAGLSCSSDHVSSFSRLADFWLHMGSHYWLIPGMSPLCRLCQ